MSQPSVPTINFIYTLKIFVIFSPFLNWCPNSSCIITINLNQILLIPFVNTWYLPIFPRTKKPQITMISNRKRPRVLSTDGHSSVSNDTATNSTNLSDTPPFSHHHHHSQQLQQQQQHANFIWYFNWFK